MAGLRLAALSPPGSPAILALSQSGTRILNPILQVPRGNPMSIKRIETGARMSMAVVHNGVANLAGVVAEKPVPSVTKQTQQILASIDKLLKKAGTNKSKILKANIWLSDMRYFAEMNAVWDGWVSKGNTPARATVEAKLATPAHWVEIMVNAAVD